jgi:hypothetical protein
MGTAVVVVEFILRHESSAAFGATEGSFVLRHSTILFACGYLRSMKYSSATIKVLQYAVYAHTSDSVVNLGNNGLWWQVLMDYFRHVRRVFRAVPHEIT